MKVIVPLAVVAILALQLSGAVPQSSVGGPMTLAVVFFAGVLAVGLHEAWINKRGVLGWILSVVVAIVGAFAAAELGNLLMEPMLMKLDLQGPLASSGHPMLYVTLACMMLLMLLGSWFALRVVGRWR